MKELSDASYRKGKLSNELLGRGEIRCAYLGHYLGYSFCHFACAFDYIACHDFVYSRLDHRTVEMSKCPTAETLIDRWLAKMEDLMRW